MTLKRIILASKSVDRGDLLKRSGISFEKFVTNINEQEYKEKFSDPVILVKELAKAKVLFAKSKLLNTIESAIIIAADTIVELNGEIIGKAHNKKEAYEILKKIVGKTHKLITGIAITDMETLKVIVDSDITFVEFLKLSDNDIKNYIKTNEWKGRAGAYSIKDKASVFISKINGSSSNVVGLPMHKVYNILKLDFGIDLFQK